ncbi:MAG: DUF4935 domain-containing protein [Fibrobacteres bacterium]|nr:DUF4935 domain-containing protein [Fibrobacterota bacterium]
MEIKVIFDTNILHTTLSHQLINTAARQFIASNSSREGISVVWVVPRIVVEERRFQMTRKGVELLQPLEKLQKLLGHDLNITPKIIDNRIDDAIQDEIQRNGITIADHDVSRIDLQDAITRSVRRLPPFEASETSEKGFRDYIVVQTIYQVISDSPASSRTCRIAILSKDARLLQCCKEMFSSNGNVSIFESIEDLESLIKTLASDLDMELWNQIQDKVQKLFFDREAKSGLYYDFEVWKKIAEKFPSQISSTPNANTRRKNGTIRIGSPSFIEKNAQRLHFETVIDLEFELQKQVVAVPALLNDVFYANSNPGLLSGLFGDTREFKSAHSSNYQIALGSPQFPTRSQMLAVTEQKTEYVRCATGKTKFSVKWKSTLTTTKKLTHSSIIDIEFIGEAIENSDSNE